MMIVFLFACLHVASSLPNFALKTSIMPSTKDVESAEDANGDDAGLGLRAKITVEKKSCSPNSYMIKDCNVCKCNALGLEERCTKNDCASLAQRSISRRSYDNPTPATTITGSCVPQNWYELGPCQFCYCQRASKLVCTTRASGHKPVTLGNYNLTDCGQALIKELYDLGVSPPLTSRTNAEKNDGHAAPAPPKPARLPPAEVQTDPHETTFALDTPDEQAYLPNVPAYLPGDVPVSMMLNSMMSKSAGSNFPLRAFKVPYESEYEDNPTALLREHNPFGHAQLVFEMVGPSPLVRNVNQKPILIPDDKLPVVNQIIMEHEMQKEMAKMLALMPAASQNHMKWEQNAKIGQEAEAGETENPQFLKPNTESMPDMEIMMRLMPPSLKRIMDLAIRKSMVKIDATKTCAPGTTTKDGCNYCYCLNNGKMLCTDKKTC